jgi:Rrf2 family protein
MKLVIFSKWGGFFIWGSKILHGRSLSMQITHQADYAIRTMLYLARLQPGDRVPTSKIASDDHIPASFLTKIVSQLSIAGLIHTSRGARGGIALARPADTITVLEVLEAIDGPVTLNECVGDPSICPFSSDCMLHEMWSEASIDLNNRLRQTNFAMLAQHNGARA